MELELGEANLLETSWALEPERLALEAQINRYLYHLSFLLFRVLINCLSSWSLSFLIN